MRETTPTSSTSPHATIETAARTTKLGTNYALAVPFFFFSSRRRHTISKRDWSSDVCSSDLGCDHPCTFCIIPELRGKFRSRRFDSVVREAKNLAAAGTREITLIGQDTTSYGEDLGLRDGLAQLLAKLAQVEELLWVRFLYAYPNRVTQKLLDTIAAHPRLANYMDMPLQHASRKVLARMKRGAHGDAFLDRK